MVLFEALAPALLYANLPRWLFRYSNRVFHKDGWEKNWNRFGLNELKSVPKRNSLVGSCVRVCRAGQGSGCRGGDLLSPPRFFCSAIPMSILKPQSEVRASEAQIPISASRSATWDKVRVSSGCSSSNRSIQSESRSETPESPVVAWESGSFDSINC